MILKHGSAGPVLNTIATVSGIVTNILFAVSIMAAFIPKFRKKAANHFVMLVREASDES